MDVINGTHTEYLSVSSPNNDLQQAIEIAKSYLGCRSLRDGSKERTELSKEDIKIKISEIYRGAIHYSKEAALDALNRDLQAVSLENAQAYKTSSPPCPLYLSVLCAKVVYCTCPRFQNSNWTHSMQIFGAYGLVLQIAPLSKNDPSAPSLCQFLEEIEGLEMHYPNNQRSLLLGTRVGDIRFAASFPKLLETEPEPSAYDLNTKRCKFLNNFFKDIEPVINPQKRIDINQIFTSPVLSTESQESLADEITHALSKQPEWEEKVKQSMSVGNLQLNLEILLSAVENVFPPIFNVPDTKQNRALIVNSSRLPLTAQSKLLTFLQEEGCAVEIMPNIVAKQQPFELALCHKVATQIRLERRPPHHVIVLLQFNELDDPIETIIARLKEVLADPFTANIQFLFDSTLTDHGIDAKPVLDKIDQQLKNLSQCKSAYNQDKSLLPSLCAEEIALKFIRDNLVTSNESLSPSTSSLPLPLKKIAAELLSPFQMFLRLALEHFNDLESPFLFLDAAVKTRSLLLDLLAKKIQHDEISKRLKTMQDLRTQLSKTIENLHLELQKSSLVPSQYALWKKIQRAEASIRRLNYDIYRIETTLEASTSIEEIIEKSKVRLQEDLTHLQDEFQEATEKLNANRFLKDRLQAIFNYCFPQETGSAEESEV